MTCGWSLIFSNFILAADQTAFIHCLSVAPTYVFLLRNSAKELSTGLAQQGPDWASQTEPFRVHRHQHSTVRLLLCRMWRMRGMLGAIMPPENILHLSMISAFYSQPIYGYDWKNRLLGIALLWLQSLSFWITWSRNLPHHTYNHQL